MDIPMTTTPCSVCYALAKERQIRDEMVQPLPQGAFASRSVKHKCGICLDCSAAETLLRFKLVPEFLMARIAVGSDREDQLRLPGVPTGLVAAGFVRVSKAGDFEAHMAWLDEIFPKRFAET